VALDAPMSGCTWAIAAGSRFASGSSSSSSSGSCRTARATAPLFQAGGAGALPADWLYLLGLYDLLFALIAYAVFDFLLED